MATTSAIITRTIPAVLVRLPRVQPEILEDLVDIAYRLVAARGRLHGTKNETALRLSCEVKLESILSQPFDEQPNAITLLR